MTKCLLCTFAARSISRDMISALHSQPPLGFDQKPTRISHFTVICKNRRKNRRSGGEAEKEIDIY